MQITQTDKKFKRGDLLSKNLNATAIPLNSLLSYYDNFVSTCLDSFSRPRPRFNVQGFFLESSIDTKIKTVPIFIFSLQRYEVRETYISCFYAQDYPALFEEFNKKGFLEDNIFFFNWFDHEDIVPKRPFHLDDISNVFYYNEGLFFDYRVFDSTYKERNITKKLIDFSCFSPSSVSVGRRFVRRNRFYKRKFDWFLKQYA